MFGSLGAPELVFILVLALLIFGPRKLPEIGRTLGRGLSEFRKASNDLKRSINAELIEEEMRQADPRKVVREALSASPSDRSAPSGPAAAGEDASGAERDAPRAGERSDDRAETASEPPSRTVARGRSAPPASEDGEPAPG